MADAQNGSQGSDSPPVWLVTGGTGFLGRHVLAALRDTRAGSIQVVALGRRLPDGWSPDAFRAVDLKDREGLTRAIAGLSPSVVIHAAGQTPPALPVAFYKGNMQITANLLDALRATGRPARVVLAGSAAELGPVPVAQLPVGEEAPCRPQDHYGLSKWFAFRYGMLQLPPLEVIAARVFNPVGPGLPPSQAFGRFATILAEAGRDPVHLTVGDLDTRRDFIDVRDVADAFLALARHGTPRSVYHVGTGDSHPIGEGLERLIALSGRAVTVEVAALPGHRRGPADSRAEIRRIVADTGWRPRIGFEQSLADLWDEARHRASCSGPNRHVA